MASEFIDWLKQHEKQMPAVAWADHVYHLAASVGAPGMNWAGQVSLAPGAHSLTVRAFVDAGTGKVGANNGATGNPPNAVLRAPAAGLFKGHTEIH